MVELVGFPVVDHISGGKPGEGFVALVDGRVVYCVRGPYYSYMLLGHGEAPKRLYATLDGPIALLPGAVQVRPIRDKPWSMDWRGGAMPGDIVLSQGTAFMKMQSDPDSQSTTGGQLINLKTGESPLGSASGPVFRGWELICFPLPNRPMLLGTFDPVSQRPNHKQSA